MTRERDSTKAIAYLALSADAGGQRVRNPVARGAQMPRRSLRARSGHAAVAITPWISGLFVRTDERCKHGLNFRFNWRHPLALPACCVLAAATPCLALLAGYVWVARRIDRRHAKLHNARMQGRTL
jgi:hypothetical protein